VQILTVMLNTEIRRLSHFLLQQIFLRVELMWKTYVFTHTSESWIPKKEKKKRKKKLFNIFTIHRTNVRSLKGH